MKILIVDPISYIGHVNYNYGIIRGIAQYADYSILVNHKMEDELIKKGISKELFLPSYSNEWDLASLAKKYKSKLVYHLLFRKHFLDVAKSARKIAKEYDAVLFTSVDIISFAPVSFLYKGNYNVVDHGIGSVNTSKIYRHAWKLCSHRIKLLVLEKFIKDMIKSFDPRRNVYVVHHPIPDKLDITKDASDDQIFIFAPSASNNKKFIEELKRINLPTSMRILIKGKEEYDKGGLKIYNNRITDEEYSSYLSQADYVLLAYEDDYDYRTSAVLFEAARQNIPVIILDNNTLRNYKEVFSDNVFLVRSAMEMIEIAEDHVNDTRIPYDLSEYEDAGIGEAILSAIEG
jgi:hypothetical protein